MTFEAKAKDFKICLRGRPRGLHLCELNVVIRCEKVFECVILAEKSDSISAKTFFFWRPLVLWAEKTFEFPNLAEKSDSISAKFFFFFWRPPGFGLKNCLNFRIWPKNQTQFRRSFFFFLETTCFWAEKSFELSAFREISSQFTDKPCETDSRAMKIRVKVVCTFLTLLKKPPPFSKSWLRACC